MSYVTPVTVSVVSETALPHGVKATVLSNSTTIYTLPGNLAAEHHEWSNRQRFSVNLDGCQRADLTPLAAARIVFELAVPHVPDTYEITVHKKAKAKYGQADRSYKYTVSTFTGTSYLFPEKWERRNDTDKVYLLDGSSITWGEYGQRVDAYRSEQDAAREAQQEQERLEARRQHEARIEFVKGMGSEVPRSILIELLEGKESATAYIKRLMEAVEV